MKSFIKNIVFVTIPAFVVILLVLEIIFRILPTSDYPKYTFDETYQIRVFDPKWKTSGKHSIGRNCSNPTRWLLNQSGWVSDMEYVARKDKNRIAIVGDSYVQAMQVNTGEAFPQLLRKALGDSLDVYSFGMGGANLYHYYHMAQYVDEAYNPDILIFNIIHNDFDESIAPFFNYNRDFWTLDTDGNQKPAVFTPLHPVYDGSKDGLKSIIKRSALFRYFNYNLSVRLNLSYKKRAEHLNENLDIAPDAFLENNINVGLLWKEQELIRSMTLHVTGLIRSRFPDKEIIFMMDAPRQRIYEGKLAESKVTLLNQITKDACAENNIHFLDLTPSFAEDYSKSKTKFEFEMDYHWNKYGHQLVMEALKSYLVVQKII